MMQRSHSHFVTPGLTRGPASSAQDKAAGPRLRAGVTWEN